MESALYNRLNDEKNDLSFSEIQTVPQIWDWLEDSLLETVFPKRQWYNGDLFTSEEEIGYVFFYNKPCGGAEFADSTAGWAVGDSGACGWTGRGNQASTRIEVELPEIGRAHV